MEWKKCKYIYRLNHAEERICELENRPFDIIQSEGGRVEEWEAKKAHVNYGIYIIQNNICTMRVHQKAKRERGKLKEIMTGEIKMME